MKKGYVAPTMTSEQFMANEYVSACGYYKWKCAGENDAWLSTLKGDQLLTPGPAGVPKCDSSKPGQFLKVYVDDKDAIDDFSKGKYASSGKNNMFVPYGSKNAFIWYSEDGTLHVSTQSARDLKRSFVQEGNMS